MSESKSTFESTTGGVMTVKVGAITGEMEISTTPKDGSVEVRVRYLGAEEWYTVEGSPAATPLRENDCHRRVVEILTTPGQKRGFNEEPVALPDEIA
ncbi:MAG: hypothetical protein ACR2KW_09160 [Rubrobacter sp.]